MLGGSELSQTSANTPHVPNGGPIRLNGIKGYSSRTNNIIFCPPLIRSTNNNKDEGPGQAVIYFGGDVQDVPESMEDNRDTKGYVKFNLDNTATILRESFPRAFIIVIRPARMEFTTFSCFDNFVRGNNVGIPDHTPMHFALQHLEEILINITKKLKTMSESELVSKLLEASPTSNNTSSSSSSNDQEDMHIDILQVHDNATSDSDMPSVGFTCKEDACNSLPTIPIASDLTPDLLQSDLQSSLQTPPSTTTPSPSSNNPRDPHDLMWWRESINLDKANLVLMGFSKGCVVLNQFIYEFHYMKTLTPDDSSMMKLVSRIKHMYWLDGGHGGGKNTWITARSLLETLCRLGISVHVHVTPYQVQDDHRPWLRKEEKQFTDLLKKLGCAGLSRTLHSGDSNMSNLFTHFEVLENFKKYQLQLQQQALTQPAQSSPQEMIQEKEQSTQQQNQIIQKTPSSGETKNAT